MRRLGALIITMALAWLVVLELGTGPSGSTALALGLALIAASIVGWLVAFLKLPRITGYLAFGLLCGPAVADIMTLNMARDLRAASGFAIALIAFIAGLQFPLIRRKPLSLRRVTFLALATIAIAWVVVAAALFLAWPWIPIAPDLAGAQRLVVIAIATTMIVAVSPTVTVAVIAEARASGALTALATSTVVLVELFIIIIFTFGLASSRISFGTTPAAIGPAVVSLLWTILGSAAFGALLGALFALYLKWIGREVTLILLALCAILAGLGVGLHIEPFVAGLVAGLIVQGVQEDVRVALLDAIRDGATPVLVLFFAAIGASMNVDAIRTVGVMAIGVAIARFAVMRGSVALGARLAGFEAAETGRLWTALLPTSGVTLGFASVVAGEHPTWGGSLQALIVATVAIYEVAGPIIFRAALAQAGEVGISTGGLVVVSNREPWIHEYAPDGTIHARPTPGGVSVALDALMRERGGVWIAHGAGSADRAVTDARGSVDVPPDAPAYRLRRIWLSQAEVDGYYSGFANGGLWPLCHQAHVRPHFHESEWQTYQSVNRRFAEIVAAEAPPDSSVFLNDYHLAMVGGILRGLRSRLRTALFWHIPWPDVDRLRICPWRKELLEGLLANDLLAFQVERDQKNFLAAVTAELGVSVSGENAYFCDRNVRVVNVPIGADYDRISGILADPDLPARIERLRTELDLQGRIVGLGVDRLDYTKGIPERMRAIERVLERTPLLVDRFAFVQIGVPSRGEVPAYADISAEIDSEVDRINNRFGRGPNAGPIRYLKSAFELPDLVAMYRIARFCIVSSLHDGMNLVAKEFVAARDDMGGVLILSEMAGAAQELHEALIINPYDDRGFTDAIARAIEMPPWERRRRMQGLHRRVAGRDVLAWASNILDRLERRKGQGFLSG